MRKGDTVRVVTGEYAGQHGRVIRVMRGWLTVLRQNGAAFDARAEDCELLEVDK